jgi:hypothetical protein
MVNNSEVLEELFISAFTDHEIRHYISAIIFNRNTISFAEVFGNLNYTSLFPLFSLGNIGFTQLAQYDVNFERANYSLEIFWFKFEAITTTDSLLYVAIFISLVITIFYCWWYYITYRLYVNHTTHLQKTVSSFPLMRIITAYLLVYYIYVNRNTMKPMEYELISVYLEIIMQTLVFVYKTFFWFIVFLIASGWQIYRNWLSPRELRSFVFFYMMIFLLICFDQILDIVFEKEFYIVFCYLLN